MSGLAVALAAAISAADVPNVWQVFHQNRSGSKMTRDAGGYLYMASKEVFGSGSVLTLEKYAPNGTKSWNQSFTLSNSFIKPVIRSIASDNTYVYVVVNELDPSTPSVVLKSRLVVYSQNSGAVVVSLIATGSEYISVASNNNQVALLLENESNQNQVLFYNRSNWSYAGGAVAGGGPNQSEIRMDAAGNAYFAYSVTSPNLIAFKCSAAGGIIWSTVLGSDFRTNGKATQIELDSANGRLHIMADYDFSPVDADVVLFSVNTDTNAAITSVVGGSALNEYSGEMTVVSNGVIVSTVVPSTNSINVLRRNTNGAAVWGRGLASVQPIGVPQHGFDVDGNLVVLSRAIPSWDFQFDRLELATGAIMDRQKLDPGTSQTQTNMYLDSAANFFILSEVGFGSKLQRMQRAELTFDGNNLPGGTSTTGRLKLGSPAASAQTWNLASANAAVASVPATVDVIAGANEATFNVTTSPVSAITNVSINARYGGFVCQQTLTVLPSVVNGLTITPQVVKGGVMATGTVTLRGKAIAGGLTVFLSSNKTVVASVPGNVAVPAGESQASFPITTFGVNSNQGVVITATTGAVSKTAFFAVNAPALQSITVTPGSIQGGNAAGLSVTIDGIAPIGGFSIVLFSGAPGIVTLPASAVVPANTTSKTVGALTSSVSSSLTVTLIATRSGIYKTTTLTVTP